jgi:hypothetical protein
MNFSSLKSGIRHRAPGRQAIYTASHNQFLIKAVDNPIDSTSLLAQSTLAHTASTSGLPATKAHGSTCRISATLRTKNNVRCTS